MLSRTRSFAFGAKFNGIDVFDEEKLFGHQIPRTGITYHQELEWMLAAQWAHYKLEEYELLSGERQSIIVAMYRVSHQIEAVLNEDSRMKAEHARLAAEVERMATVK